MDEPNEQSGLSTGQLSWMATLALTIVGIVGSLVAHGRGPDAAPMILLGSLSLAVVIGGGLAIHALIKRRRSKDVPHAVAGLLCVAVAAFLVFNILSIAAETREYIKNQRKAAEQRTIAPE